MTELQPFTFPDTGQQVRTVVIDAAVWFVAVDVCAVLGLAQPHRSLAALDEDEKGRHSMTTPGGEQQVSIISEPGLYSLVLRSRKPEARAFRRWVTHDVLPSIRQTGTYSAAPHAAQIPQTFADALELAARQARELEATREQVAELTPAAAAWDALANAQGDYSLREAAQALDRDPAISTGQKRLAAYLREIGWTDRTGQPYQRHVDLGRLVRRVRTYSHPRTSEEQTTTQLRITVRGLRELRDLLATGSQLTLGGL